MRVVGIDPGLKGGLATVESSRPGEVDLLPMPTIGGKDFDIQIIKEYLKNRAPYMVMLEQQIALPGQGLSSTLQTGKGFGILLGLLAGLEIPHTVISARMWQHKMFVGVSAKLDTKVKSEIIAKRLFPLTDFRVSSRARVSADGLTDAACIAMYGVQTLSGKKNTSSDKVTKHHRSMPLNPDICVDCGVFIPGADEQCNKYYYDR